MAKTVGQRVADLEKREAPAPGAEGIALMWADGTPCNDASKKLIEHWRRIGYTPRKVALTWPDEDDIEVADEGHRATSD